MKELPLDFLHNQYYPDKTAKLLEDLIGPVTANQPMSILPIFGTFLDGIFRDENGKTCIPVCYNIETEIAVGKFTNNKDVLPKNIEINIDIFTIYNRYKVIEIEENKKLFIYYTGRIENAIESFRRAEAKKETENY